MKKMKKFGTRDLTWAAPDRRKWIVDYMTAAADAVT